MRASPVGAHTYAEDTDTDTTGDTGGEPSVTAAPTAADGAKAGAESVAGPSLFLDPRLNGYMSRLGMTMVYHRKNYFVGGCLQTNSNVPVTGLFVKEVVVDAGIHLLVWLGPLVAVVVSALQAQIIYARTSGVMVPGLVDGSNAGRIEWHAKDKYYYPSYVLIVWICAVSSAIALIILVHGVTEQSNGWASVVFRRVIGGFVCLYFFSFIALIVLTLLWSLVAAVIEPSVSLAKGLVIVVVVGVSYNVLLRFKALREFVLIHVKGKLNTKLQENIDTVLINLKKTHPLLYVESSRRRHRLPPSPPPSLIRHFCRHWVCNFVEPSFHACVMSAPPPREQLCGYQHPFTIFILAHPSPPFYRDSHTVPTDTISQPTTLTFKVVRRPPPSTEGPHNGMAPSALTYSLAVLSMQADQSLTLASVLSSLSRFKGGQTKGDKMDLEGVFGLLNTDPAEDDGQEELEYSEFEGTATSTSFRPF